MSKLTLYDTNPDLREEWDEEKNGSMKNYTKGMGKKFGGNVVKTVIMSGNRESLIGLQEAIVLYVQIN